MKYARSWSAKPSPVKRVSERVLLRETLMERELMFEKRLNRADLWDDCVTVFVR